MSDANPPESLPDIGTKEGSFEFYKRCRNGDEAMLPLLKKVFSPENPRKGQLIEAYGDSFQYARDSLIRSAAGKNLMLQEAVKRKIDAVRDELAGPNPTPLERLLCERVALCWYDAHESDRRFVDPTGLSFQAGEYAEFRRDRAHRRFLAACKTLATVRKLALPALQVNLGQNQVNMA